MKNAIKKGFRWIDSYTIPDLGNGESVLYEHFYCLTGFKLQNLIFQRRSLQKRNVVRIKTLTDLLKCHYQGIKRKGRRDGESTLFIHFCGICRAACRSKLFIIGLCISCKNLARALLWYDFCHFVSLFSLKEARIFHLKKSGFFQNIRLVILLHSIFHQVYIRPNLCKHGFSECLQVLS